MRTHSKALAMPLLAGVLFMSTAIITQGARAQTNSPPATATRPAANLPEQSSQPSNAPPASRTQNTGQTNQDPVIKEMNAKERSKVEREGK